MTGFTIFHPLWVGFYSKPFYRQAAEQWRWKSFFAMSVTLALCWIPGFFRTMTGIGKVQAAIEKQILPQVPPFSIENGELRTPDQKAYFVYADDKKTGTPLVVIDPTGKTDLQPSGTEPQIILVSGKLLVHQRSGETRVYDLSKLKHFAADKDKLHGWIASGVALLPIFLFPVMYALSFIKRLLEALALSLCAMMIASLRGRKLGYGSLLSLSFVALIPLFVAETLWGVTGRQIPSDRFFWLAVMLGLNAFAVVSSDPVPAPTV